MWSCIYFSKYHLYIIMISISYTVSISFYIYIIFLSPACSCRSITVDPSTWQGDVALRDFLGRNNFLEGRLAVEISRCFFGEKALAFLWFFGAKIMFLGGHCPLGPPRVSLFTHPQPHGFEKEELSDLLRVVLLSYFILFPAHCFFKKNNQRLKLSCRLCPGALTAVLSLGTSEWENLGNTWVFSAVSVFSGKSEL